jgi:hypothetical protein
MRGRRNGEERARVRRGTAREAGIGPRWARAAALPRDRGGRRDVCGADASDCRVGSSERGACGQRRGAGERGSVAAALTRGTLPTAGEGG